jgi:putative hydrolase
VLETDPAELQSRAQAGTLTDLPGIGSSTEAVIRQALDGQIPEYLTSMEAKAAKPLVAGGLEVRAALRGDLHSHSDWSDGGSPIQEMVVTAMELGHDYLVQTDHSPRLTVANGLSAERLTKQLRVIEEINPAVAPFRLLKGIEVDILDDGSLDQSTEMLAQLDLRVASVHSKLKMSAGPMTRRMVAAVQNPHTNVLGHCTGRLVEGERGTRAQSSFDAAAVFEACAAHDVAVEINARPERCDPPDDLLALALEAGCLFSIDSDAHAPGQLDLQIYGCARAEMMGVPVERIVNTWPLDRLLTWANPH